MSNIQYKILSQHDLIKQDKEEYYSSQEYELFSQKYGLAQNTRLSNLLSKIFICELLQISLQDSAQDIEILRKDVQGFGYGRPYIVLKGNISNKWKQKFDGFPDISLSGDQDHFAVMILFDSQKESGMFQSFPRIGIDLVHFQTIESMYHKGAFSPYLTDWEFQFIEKIPKQDKKIEYILAVWSLKEALFKAIGSNQLRGSHNRFPYMEMRPLQTIEGRWQIKILTDDQPVKGKDHWYPKLVDIIYDEKIDLENIQAVFQRVEDYGFAYVQLQKES